MRNYLLFLGMLIALFFPTTSHAEEMVTVKLINHIGETSKLTFQLKGDYFTLDPTVTLQEGVDYQLFVRKDSLFLKGDGKSQKINGSFILIPQTYNLEHSVRVNDRAYLGAMEFTVENKQFIRPINQLPLEDYLKGVIPFEVFPTWGLETLKAQTLAARTYAVSKIDKVIDDTISYQVYGGYAWSDMTTKAVEETKGQVVTFENRLIETFYSASNGGITENNTNVWGGESLHYFPIKKDPYDPTHPWSFTLNQTQINLENIDWGPSPKWWDEIQEKDEIITSSMKKWLQRNGYPGDIKILSIPVFEISEEQLDSKRSVKGSITIEFFRRLMEGTVFFEQVALDHVPLNRIRPMIGGTIFKSYLIESLELDDGIYIMDGKGYGHGVGMSQWGAHIMGEDGKSYQEILQFYYPGTKITDYTKIKRLQ